MNLVGAVGQTWEAGEVKTRVPYKVFSRRIINASLGVKIGLQSVNITLLSMKFHLVCFIQYYLRFSVNHYSQLNRDFSVLIAYIDEISGIIGTDCMAVLFNLITNSNYFVSKKQCRKYQSWSHNSVSSAVA